ncbi:MAG TPA: hypothetical protein DDW42_08245 [Desulfobacteraceae bacterium]|nr:hypothetical protein [Desulfobacteraceae bacterium]
MFAKQFIDLREDNKIAIMKLAAIKETLRAEVFTAHDKLDTEIVAGTASDLMSDMLTGPTNGVVLLTGLNNIQAIHTCIIADVAGVVLLRKKRPTAEMISQAREHELPLLSTPFTMFSACGRLFEKGLRGVERSPST